VICDSSVSPPFGGRGSSTGFISMLVDPPAPLSTSMGCGIVKTLIWSVICFGGLGGAVYFTYDSRSLKQTVAMCAIILMLKGLVIALLTVRAKIIGGAEAFGGGQKEAANLLFILFKPLLLAYSWAPWGGGADAAARFLRCVANNSEFEPAFVGGLIAVYLALDGKKDPIISSLALLCTYSRVAHTFFFVMFPVFGPEPRTMSFDCFFFGALGLGVYAAVMLL